MNIISAIIFLAGGLVILWKCADWLVTGAVGFAEKLGISPLVVGLTVVAMGTSAPEVAASIAAALRGAGDVAIGNVYGSNIANLALVGGLCALISPIRIQVRTLHYQIPVMLLVGLLLWPFLHNLYLSRTEGVILLGIFAILILLTVLLAHRDTPNPSSDKPDTQSAMRTNKQITLLIIIGLAGLAVGADMTVRGAVFIGERIGLNQAVIGLTIIAIGTSLPELATCLVAALKRQSDISIGNLVGSNIFNTLLVTGTAGLVQPLTLAERLAGADYWIMIAVSAGFASAALIGRCVIGRTAGILLLCVYAAYMVYLLAFSV